MGTNFYTLDGIHIGKRTAAGVYCWDCRAVVLVRLDDDRIVPRPERGNEPRFQGRTIVGYVCPVCGRHAEKSKGGYQAAFVELGFQDALAQAVPQGIGHASGFIWQTGGCGLADDLTAVQQALVRRRVIRDEYGRRYSRAEFAAVLARCIPIDEDDRDFT